MKRSWHQAVKRSPASERTSQEGIVFDSKAELRRWEELKLLERAGTIKNLKRQHRLPLTINGRDVKIRSRGFPNGRPCVYTADFSYIDSTGREVFEEHKGVWTAEARLRIAVVEAMYGITITVTGAAVLIGEGHARQKIAS